MTSSYIQINLKKIHYVCAVASEMKSHTGSNNMIKYKMKWSKDSFNWTYIKDEISEKQKVNVH